MARSSSYPSARNTVRLLTTLFLSVLVVVLVVITYKYYSNAGHLTESANVSVSAMRKAQEYAKATDQYWGTRIVQGEVIVFLGEDFESRNTEEDVSYKIPDEIDHAGKTLYVFRPETGLPVDIGEAVLSEPGGNSRLIVVSEDGVVIHREP